MTDEQRELMRIAHRAIHKLAIEIGRGTASSRAEYEHAIDYLPDMERELAQGKD